MKEASAASTAEGRLQKLIQDTGSLKESKDTVFDLGARIIVYTLFEENSALVTQAMELQKQLCNRYDKGVEKECFIDHLWNITSRYHGVPGVNCERVAHDLKKLDFQT